MYCNNRSVGRLLHDARSAALLEPGREAERRVFFEEHLDECRACRNEMIDHANQIALNEIAEESGVGVEVVVERLGETEKQLRDFARDHDIPFEEVVIGIVRGRSHISKNSTRMGSARSVASTEA
jgi:hypothetical protein